ncbi:FecR family protein [Brevundimonas sp.]|uniref:FecR family protein n=1 Tax=Brevundimonas sp. TaxID=1871086 RepID=UPI0039191DE5
MSRAPSPRAVEAEAAAWLARVHGDQEDAARDALDAWLAEDPAHAAAFERASEIWAILPRAARSSEDEARLRAAPEPQPRLRAAMAMAASLVLGLGALWWALDRPGDYVTRPGEQQVATLGDGSRIALNTDTRVAVQYNADRRHITLDRGEAMFEVAHDADRPFVVIAGDTRIEALGTVFTVRRTRDEVVVTLIKGEVAVTLADARASGAPQTPMLLQPGERLTEPVAGPTRIESASVEAATAWRRGQTVFRDTPLGEAVTELNRYGGPQVIIDDPRVAALPISGVFTTNAPDFAEAVADLHGLDVQREGDTLHLQR